MESSLFRFIWKYSARQQITIVLITVLSFPALYMMLEVPKLIVNDAIQGDGFPRVVLGVELGQIPYLFALCVGFLSLVVVNNGVKFVLNVYKGLTGERMLRRLRFDLFQRVLRFRLPQFRRISSSEIIPMITAEVEDLGGFIGDAIAVPAFQGGTLLVYISFIFAQDPMLGAAAVSLYPLQAFVIPKLQKRVVQLSRLRVRNVRQVADKIGESINGAVEIHANDTSALHMAELSERLHTNFTIRYDIFKRKYMIKFVNNFMNQLTPFFFYSIGGYLVIQGEISFGALVAVLAAYKDLAGPWKELLGYYQQLADVDVKYQAVIENFDPPNLYPVERLTADEVKQLSGDLQFSDVSFSGGAAGQEVHHVSLKVPQGKTVAIVGLDGSGRSETLQLAAGILTPDSGRVEVGTSNLEDLGEATLGRSIAYVTNAPHIFSGTIRDNLFYGLRHRPQKNGEAESSEAAFRRMEALATANSTLDVQVPWEDYAAAGAENVEALDARALEVVDAVGLGDGIYRMGLQSSLDPVADGVLAGRILEVRKAIAGRVCSDRQLQDLVELWDIARFNNSATLGENLLYGVPAGKDMTIDKVAADPQVASFLKAQGLYDRLLEIGGKIADTMIELFASISSDSGLLGTYSFITQDELPEFERILRKARAGGDSKLNDEEGARLIGLTFKLIPARHRLGVVDDTLAADIVAARKRFHEEVGTASRSYVLFNSENYIGPLTIEDNLLFGRPRVDRRDSRERIDQLIGATVSEMALRDPILRAGLDFHVGVAGSRLTAGQRRRVALARGLLKRPDMMILDEVATGSGPEDARLRQMIRCDLAGKTLLFGISAPDVAAEFDVVVTMENGRIVSSKAANGAANAEMAQSSS